MKNKHMNIDLNDKFEVKNIHFGVCDKTSKHLVSMLIPVDLPEGTTSWEWATMEFDDFASLLIRGFIPDLRKFQRWENVSIPALEFEDYAYDFVADIFMEPCMWQRVEYIDGNPLNLRKNNLRLVPDPEAPARRPTN
jgi:hypothetical protein